MRRLEIRRRGHMVRLPPDDRCALVSAQRAAQSHEKRQHFHRQPGRAGRGPALPARARAVRRRPGAAGAVARRDRAQRAWRMAGCGRSIPPPRWRCRACMPSSPRAISGGRSRRSRSGGRTRRSRPTRSRCWPTTWCAMSASRSRWCSPTAPERAEDGAQAVGARHRASAGGGRPPRIGARRRAADRGHRQAIAPPCSPPMPATSTPPSATPPIPAASSSACSG